MAQKLGAVSSSQGGTFEDNTTSAGCSGLNDLGEQNVPEGAW